MQLLEPLDIDARERLELQVRERPAAPQALAVPQHPGRASRVPLLERSPPLGQQPLEAVQVELAGLDVHEVAGRAREEDRVGAERLAQPRHVDLERVARRRRRVLGPQLLDQAVAGDDPVGLQQQDRQQRALLRAAEREPAPVRADLERTEDAEVDATRRPATFSRSRAPDQVESALRALRATVAGMTTIHLRAAAAAAILAGALALAAPAAAKPALQCGDTVTRSVTLTRSLTNCPDKGLVIGADGITVDLNGHTIDGTVTQLTDCDVPPFGPAGITTPATTGMTIKNGTLQQFFAGFGAGTETTGMSNSTLRDLTARDNRFAGITMGSRDGHNDGNRIVHNHVYGNGCGDGIALNTARGNLVAHNRSHDNGEGIGICCGQDNVVRDNVVTRNADNGIGICCDGRANLIEGNRVTDNANNGIIVFFNAEGTLIRRNHVARNGDGIVIDEASGNTVAYNVVSDALGCPFCDPPTGFGIAVVADAVDNTIVGNLVSRTKEDGIRVLDFDPADPGNPVPSGTVMRGNLVSRAGHDGIRTDSADAVLTRNAAVLQPRPRDRGRAGRHRRRRQPGPPQRRPGAVRGRRLPLRSRSGVEIRR